MTQYTNRHDRLMGTLEYLGITPEVPDTQMDGWAYGSWQECALDSILAPRQAPEYDMDVHTLLDIDGDIRNQDVLDMVSRAVQAGHIFTKAQHECPTEYEQEYMDAIYEVMMAIGCDIVSSGASGIVPFTMEQYTK